MEANRQSETVSPPDVRISSIPAAGTIPPAPAESTGPPKVGKWVFRLPGSRWLLDNYIDRRDSQTKAKIENFDRLKTYPLDHSDTKRRIQPRVEESIDRIEDYLAWENLIDKISYNVLSKVILVAVVVGLVLLAMPVVIQPGLGILEYVPPIFVAIVTIFIYFIFVSILGSIFGKMRGNGAVVSLILVPIIAVVVLSINSIIVEMSWSINTGLRVGLFAFAAFVMLPVSTQFFGSFVSSMIRRAKIRRFPEEEIIATLCFVLNLLEEEPDRWKDKGWKELVIHFLEQISLVLENELPHHLLTEDADVDDWMRGSTREMAATVRRLKQYVSLTKENSRTQLMEALATRLVYAADGNWGLFERSDAYGAYSPFSRLLRALRVVVSIGYPLVFVPVLAILPLEAGTWGSLIVVIAGWVAKNAQDYQTGKSTSKT